MPVSYTHLDVYKRQPPKYADFRESGLVFTLTEPTDDLKIELTWDGGKPFVQ